MPINITDELHAATTKGKIASAKEVYLTGDTENLQQIGEKTHQLEDSIKNIAATGGASTAAAVTFDNVASGMTAVNAQAAIEELNTKNKTQDTEIAKKVDKTSIVQEFGEYEDKVVSQFALPFREIESPEFIHCIVDSDNHLLFGIQLDGSIEWGKGIPTPIKDKMQDIINQSQQDKTDLSETINTLNGILDKTTIKDDEGAVVETPFRIIENEEFLCAMVDAEDKILFGISKKTGKPYYPLNDMYHVEQNEEYFAAWIDADNHLLLGIRRDGQIIGEINAVNALKQTVDKLQEEIDIVNPYIKELLDVFSLKENPEFLSVETDTNGKILASTNADGSHYIYNAKSETIPEEFNHIEDLEGRMEITTDSDERVMSYRDSNGKKHEHDMNITNLEVSNLNLQGNSVNNIQDALKGNGFDVKTPIDWSESDSIQVPTPRLAFVNISNIDAMPTSKTQDLHAIFEFWDMQGNYFKKNVILNAQGNSSMSMPKKNFACDFCNDNWIGDNTFKMKFGDWVSQDSFHFKAYYADFFKGVSIVGYKLFNEIEETKNFISNRIWKRALLPSNETIGYGTKGMKDVNDMNLLIDNGARCYPDGFPCIVNLNGEFYGIFSWAIKKHRDNYMQNKSTSEHIQLDGDIYDTFTYNGNINWNVINGKEATSNGNKDGVEFRNPKSLICIDGTKYNADTNRKELIDSDSPSYKAGDKNHVLTNKVKGYYKTLTTYIPTLNNMISDGKEDSELKNKILEFFDVEGIIDYLIFSDVVMNIDGFRKNWQWVTYDGTKWAVCPYDLDGILGWGGWGEVSPISERLGNTLETPTGWIIKYFDTELCERYKELRSKVLTEKNIYKMLTDWCSTIGASNFEKDLIKWPMTPTKYPYFKETHTDNLYRVYNWIAQRLKECDKIYKFNL